MYLRKMAANAEAARVHAEHAELREAYEGMDGDAAGATQGNALFGAMKGAKAHSKLDPREQRKKEAEARTTTTTLSREENAARMAVTCSE